mmetsp:Transcript_27029/g.46586  ORF Transcript_27029/g.46586 Transcript_27029/m.46586 type:complete len:205 (-) Transcript_27029:798-1412(-)
MCRPGRPGAADVLGEARVDDEAGRRRLNHCKVALGEHSRPHAVERPDVRVQARFAALGVAGVLDGHREVRQALRERQRLHVDRSSGGGDGGADVLTKRVHLGITGAAHGSREGHPIDINARPLRVALKARQAQAQFAGRTVTAVTDRVRQADGPCATTGRRGSNRWDGEGGGEVVGEEVGENGAVRDGRGVVPAREGAELDRVR